MDNIEIKRDGQAASTVVFGADLYGFASLLKGDVLSCGSPVLFPADCKLFLVYDSEANVLGHANDLSRVVDFAGKFPVVNVSEENKTMDTVLEICRWLLDKGADRNSVVVGLGGGILLDIVGFAAGIYKRGVRCVYIPTTLLAQVDAAIGGKTGVNLDGYKNILGVFKQPELTYICPQVLETLPPAIFRDGLAEMLKTFIIDNGLSFDGEVAGADGERGEGRVERMLKVVGQINEAGSFVAASEAVRGEFGELVAAAAGVKAGVVGRDELESGERRKLNLGHTFAHAIEYVSHSRAAKSKDSSCGEAVPDGTSDGHLFSHGEAVAIGLAMAARLSVKLGVAEPHVEREIVEALEVCDLPTVCPYPLETLVDAMSKDKKVEGDKIHFVLIRSIGDVVIHDLTLNEVL